MIDDRYRRRQRVRNTVQGVLLLLGMVLIFGALAWLVFGPSGLVTVVVLGALFGLLRPKVPTGWLLRMYGAQPLPESVAPDLHRAVGVLASRAGLSQAPQLYYVPTQLPNAFTTGSGDDTAIALTDGILRRLSGPQLLGVLAHEISHVRSGDQRIMNLSDSIARLTQGLSYAGLLLLLLSLPITFGGNDFRPLIVGLVLMLLPTLTTLLQLALSRSREYDADLEAASLTGDPEALASGLEALEASSGGSIWERLMVPRQRVPDPILLRSHPPTGERTRRLRSLSLEPRPTDPIRNADDVGHPPVTAPPRLRAPGIRW